MFLESIQVAHPPTHLHVGVTLLLLHLQLTLLLLQLQQLQSSRTSVRC